MPGMNVRGDQYLNFTTEEAAAWLGGREVQHQADEDRTGVGGYVVGLLGAVAICIVLAMISTMVYAIAYGLAHPQMASGLTQSSIQSSTATAQGMGRADFPRPKYTVRRRDIPRALGRRGIGISPRGGQWAASPRISRSRAARAAPGSGQFRKARAFFTRFRMRQIGALSSRLTAIFGDICVSVHSTACRNVPSCGRSTREPLPSFTVWKMEWSLG